MIDKILKEIHISKTPFIFKQVNLLLKYFILIMSNKEYGFLWTHEFHLFHKYWLRHLGNLWYFMPITDPSLCKRGL